MNVNLTLNSWRFNCVYLVSFTKWENLTSFEWVYINKMFNNAYIKLLKHFFKHYVGIIYHVDSISSDHFKDQTAKPLVI